MTMPTIARAPARISVLASGGGSNLQALIDHFAGPAASAGVITFVASERATAGALDRALWLAEPFTSISLPSAT